MRFNLCPLQARVISRFGHTHNTHGICFFFFCISSQTACRHLYDSKPDLLLLQVSPGGGATTQPLLSPCAIRSQLLFSVTLFFYFPFLLLRRNVIYFGHDRPPSRQNCDECSCLQKDPQTDTVNGGQGQGADEAVTGWVIPPHPEESRGFPPMVLAENIWGVERFSVS